MIVHFIAFAVCIVGSSAVIGGGDTTLNDHPYIAAISYNGLQVCAGTIISGKHIVTAAHCVFTYPINEAPEEVAKKFKVKVKPVLGTQNFDVAKIVIHDDYKPDRTDKNDRMFNDIAILTVKPFLLPNPLQSNKINVKKEIVGDKVTLVGWGSTKPVGDISDKLQQVDLNVIRLPACQTAYGKIRPITKEQICTTTSMETKPVGICYGDSGGPLIETIANVKSLVGIVSWGTPCAREEKPDVFTSINSYYEWINEPEQCNKCLPT